MFSSRRMTVAHGALLVIDPQVRLMPHIWNAERLVKRIRQLIRGARLLHVPVLATEHYPHKLGPTVPELADLLPDRHDKTTFHALGAVAVSEKLMAPHCRHVTLAGIEAHVCVAQTALELLDRGLTPQIPADAVSSRTEFDWEVALRRLERAGAIITTTEAVLFEWMETAEHPNFKAVSKLITEETP